MRRFSGHNKRGLGAWPIITKGRRPGQSGNRRRGQSEEERFDQSWEGGNGQSTHSGSITVPRGKKSIPPQDAPRDLYQGLN